MAYIKQSGLSADSPYANVPLIGYDNLVTESNISTTTEASGFPATNLANPATHLKWKGAATTGDEYITIATQLSTTASYLAIAKHNFGSQAVSVSLEGGDLATVMLHFNAPGSPDIITDDNTTGSSHVWTAAGNAFLDTTTYKFGHSSLKLDGTGDWVSTPNSVDFNLDTADFTIDLWFNCTKAGGSDAELAGQVDAGGLFVANSAWAFLRDSSNFIHIFLIQGTASAGVTGTTQFTDVLNTGWHHAAFVRTGNTIKLFIDGIQEGGDSTFTGTVNASTASLGVGSLGGLTTSPWLGWIDEFRMTIGLARWTSNFTPPIAPSSWRTLVNASLSDAQVLLHFDGGGGSTSIIDSNGVGSYHTWTAAGNAAIDLVSWKFGNSSLILDGTGDWVTTPANADFNLGANNFTIDLWFNCNKAGGTTAFMAGQMSSAGSVSADSSWSIGRTAGNVIQGVLVQGTTVTNVTGTTQFTSSTNTGWHHVAFVRTGNTLKLFIDGIQESSNVTFTGATNDSSAPMAVGIRGASTTTPWIGWIDEFRFTNGTARWTANFSVPTSAAASGSSIITDEPILFRWAPTTLINSLRLHLRPSGVAPEAAVIYAGVLLVMERSITIGQKHVPVTYGRRTTIVNGMSESGNFTGRIVLGEYRESKAEFEWFTPTFYRSSIDAFLEAAQEFPFFWAWAPDDYPSEVGYVWLTNNAEPETDPATRRVALALEMRGIA